MTATSDRGGPAAQNWADQLAEWAIPQEILDAAPESPWHFPPALFVAPTPSDEPDTPSKLRAAEAVPPGGSVLDVGAGGGAASIRLAPPADHVTAFDEGADMLESFATRAEELGIRHAEIHGRWPDVADQAPIVDVVVSHHVLYNVPDVGDFVLALTQHARRRVVVEIGATHPMSLQAPLWKHFHDLDRPNGPTADDAIAVFREVGLDVESERWTRVARPADVDRSQRVAFVRRRLCLPAERDPEVDALLPDASFQGPREVVTIWWPGTAG
ncbi:MAG TPA: methyltransferase domain-containing protein [Acidimicrobiales bacterium]|nr:methyltransferase domain-containing protein [Acidimicrobiales bacterium]